MRYDESYLMGASVKEGDVGRGLETVLTESERAARFGFEPSELEREKAAFLRGMDAEQRRGFYVARPTFDQIRAYERKLEGVEFR